MKNINQIFATNLTALVRSKGKTQKEIADALGVPAPNLSTWMQGIKLPRPETLELLAAFFGVMPADLFAEPNTTPKSPDSTLQTIVEIAQDLPEPSRARLLAYAEALRDMQEK